MGFSLHWVPLDMLNNSIDLIWIEVNQIEDPLLNQFAREFMDYLDHQWMNKGLFKKELQEMQRNRVTQPCIMF